MAVPRSIELQGRREVIERWLDSSNIPPDIRPGLLDMLSVVKEEIEKLLATPPPPLRHASAPPSDNRIPPATVHLSGEGIVSSVQVPEAA